MELKMFTVIYLMLGAVLAALFLVAGQISISIGLLIGAAFIMLFCAFKGYW